MERAPARRRPLNDERHGQGRGHAEQRRLLQSRDFSEARVVSGQTSAARHGRVTSIGFAIARGRTPSDERVASLPISIAYLTRGEEREQPEQRAQDVLPLGDQATDSERVDGEGDVNAGATSRRSSARRRKSSTTSRRWSSN
jgi:hypothetical protein